VLLGVSVSNFDVFTNNQIGLLMGEGDEHLPLRKLSSIIGRNNTGKTSFFNSLSFIKDAVTGNVADASTIRGRGGFSNMIIDKSESAVFKLNFKIVGKEKYYVQYELSIKANEYGSPYVAAEKVLLSSASADGNYEIKEVMNMVYGAGFINGLEAGINDNHLTALGVYGNISQYKELSAIYHEIARWFFCRFSSVDTDTYFVEGNAPGGHRHLNSKGTNALNVLTYMKQSDYDNYLKVIDEIYSKIPEMKLKKTMPEKVALSPDKLFLYMLLLRDSDPHSTIFIETPDKDLYHDMVDVLSNEMREFTLNSHSQIVFSTHNPYIIENMNPKEIWVFKRQFELENDSITITCAGEDNLINELFKQGIGMGAIWYGGHLDADELN